MAHLNSYCWADGDWGVVLKTPMYLHYSRSTSSVLQCWKSVLRAAVPDESKALAASLCSTYTVQHHTDSLPRSRLIFGIHPFLKEKANSDAAQLTPAITKEVLSVLCHAGTVTDQPLAGSPLPISLPLRSSVRARGLRQPSNCDSETPK